MNMMMMRRLLMTLLRLRRHYRITPIDDDIFFDYFLLHFQSFLRLLTLFSFRNISQRWLSIISADDFISRCSRHYLFRSVAFFEAPIRRFFFSSVNIFIFSQTSCWLRNIRTDFSRSRQSFRHFLYFDEIFEDYFSHWLRNYAFDCRLM